MNADRIRLGHVRAGENGTSHPAYRPPSLQNCPAPSPGIGFAAPSLNLCEAYLPQANSRTAKRIAPARGNSEANREAYCPGKGQ